MIDSRILELLNIANNEGYITYTNFLTPNLYINLANKYNNVNIFSFGKIRKIFAFVPEYYENYTLPISLLKISVNNKFRKYEHKDFLGSIMALNIKRELIGDIFVKDNIAYVYIINTVEKTIISHLKEVGKNSCIVDKIDEKIELEYDYENIKINIASNRLDNIVSSLTNYSREKSKDFITQGLVMLNYEICYDISKEIKTDSILSIRKYGKYIVKDVEKITKKNKLILNISKFI